METAEYFLTEMLADGPVPAKDMLKEAKGAGISERTLERAKGKLGVRTVRKYREGKRGLDGWVWELPGDIDRQSSTPPLVGGLYPQGAEGVGIDRHARETQEIGGLKSAVAEHGQSMGWEKDL